FSFQCVNVHQQAQASPEADEQEQQAAATWHEHQGQAEDHIKVKANANTPGGHVERQAVCSRQPGLQQQEIGEDFLKSDVAAERLDRRALDLGQQLADFKKQKQAEQAQVQGIQA